MAVELRAGDVFLVCGKGFFSSAIRFFQRSVGEGRSRVSHVGLVVKGGGPDVAEVVEALGQGVVRRPYSEGPGKEVHAVFRPLTLQDWQINIVTARAQRYVGRKYGWTKIAAQVGDWLLLNRYVFRRFAGVAKWPDCSFLTNDCFGPPVLEKPFGVQRNACTPDDIWDYCVTHADDWTCIKPLDEDL